MKVTRREILQLVREAIDEVDMIGAFAKMGELIPMAFGESDDLDEEEEHPVDTLDTAVMGKGMLYKGKKMKTPSQLSYGLDYTGSGMGESNMKITMKQLRSIIQESMSANSGFPDDPYLAGSYEGNGMISNRAWQELLPALEAGRKALYGPAISVIKDGGYTPVGREGRITYIPFTYGDKVLDELRADGVDQELLNDAEHALNDTDLEHVDYNDPFYD